MYRPHSKKNRVKNSQLWSKYKEPLSDGKDISGRGRLTEKMINKLQNLYGIVLRQNANKTVYEMKVAIGAVLYHSAEFKNTENCHLYCPQGPDTWCKYWMDRINNTNKFVEKPGMPIAIHEVIKPIFLDLRKDKQLAEPILDSESIGAFFGIHFPEKKAFCLLVPPKQMPVSGPDW